MTGTADLMDFVISINIDVAESGRGLAKFNSRLAGQRPREAYCQIYPKPAGGVSYLSARQTVILRQRPCWPAGLIVTGTRRTGILSWLRKLKG